MGASSSSPSATSREQQEEESIATSTGSLPFLKQVFSNLSTPPDSNSIPSSSLTQIFSLNPPRSTSSSPIPPPPSFPHLLSSLAPSVTSLLFPSPNNQLTWLQFLQGYNRCCSRKPASSSLALLFLLFSETCRHAGIPSNLDVQDPDGKVAGFFTPSDLLMLLWLCWVMSRSAWIPDGGGGELALPDLTHLVLSALVSSGEVGEDGDVWDCDVLGSQKRMAANKVHVWMLTTAPALAGYFSEYLRRKFQSYAVSGESPILSSGDASLKDDQDTFLLKSGTAWAISLTLRTNLSGEFLGASFSQAVSKDFGHILYRSTLHGKGLNRFWSNVEGYHGSLLILVSASSTIADESNNSTRRWVIGILTEQGFENRHTFYGDSGYLYAISPIFHVLSPSGKDKNFIYSHLHPTGKVYEPNPKPVGLAFGGTIGNERILIDEDFARVIVRHHAVDKTYQHGSLIPSQGFLPVEASLLEVEVWGFGGNAAKEKQDVYKQRESLFSEQRRKVDLKTFGNWEDSPEKMMMDMVSDPNRVQREDR